MSDRCGRKLVAIEVRSHSNRSTAVRSRNCNLMAKIMHRTRWQREIQMGRDVEHEPNAFHTSGALSTRT